MNDTLKKILSAAMVGCMVISSIPAGVLAEEEAAVAKRGQNASKASVAKNASVAEYRASTGFESLLGYLKLTNQDERIEYLVGYILENLKFE